MRRQDGSKVYLVFFVLAALVLALYAIAGVPLRRARALWREGKVAQAEALLQQWARLGLRPADYAECLAVMRLTAGDRQGGEKLLRRLRHLDRAIFTTPIDEVEVARRLVRLGRYGELLAYSEAVADDDLAFYRAAALVGSGRIREGEALLARVGRDAVEPSMIAALQATAAARRDGTYPVVVDASQQPIAQWVTASRDLLPEPHFTALVDASGGATTIESQRRVSPELLIETTIDPEVQRAAVEAISEFRGSLVAIDVERAAIVAIANTHDSGKNIALSAAYEPGSVMKVLTIAAALEGGVDVNSIFPFTCDGILEIDGRQFHDWARHEQLDSIDEALAASCNLVFARLGIMVGAPRIEEIWRKVGFGSEADLGIVRAALGRQTAPLAPDFNLGAAACGLEFETSNALHLAMIANAIANGGTFVTPRLVAARTSIVGDRFVAPAPPRSGRFASATTIAQLKKAMQAVVTDPRGSGRRAQIEQLSIAMKTGTAGERDPAYDALVIAFAPAEKPRYAIGLVAENAGPAEYAGAQITREFFSAVLK